MVNEQERQRIGARIAELRKEQGMTQTELAQRAGLERSHVVRIEAGRYNVGIDTLAAIGDAMGRSLDYVERWRIGNPNPEAWPEHCID